MTGIPLLVTLDGPAASGKSTIARKLARALKVPYLYTGMMYRALTWLARRKGVGFRDVPRLAALAGRLPIRFDFGRADAMRVFVAGIDATGELQTPEISRITSTYIAPQVPIRKRLVALQRAYPAKRGLVAEGRDTGSVVFPNAPYKFFLTASLEVRARRREADLRRAGIMQPLAGIRRDLKRRDIEDATRKQGRLRAEPDCWVIDNSRIDVRETLERMLRRIRHAV